jgi:sugar phosphate isomerase/epimerase
MKLKLFKTLWGHEGGIEQACEQALAAGFHGIEGAAPLDSRQQAQWQNLFTAHGLEYIAEITTAGTYVPRRQATPAEHLDSFKRKLEASLAINPRFITSLAGCDAWEEKDSIVFFEQAMKLAKEYRVDVSFETHRSRSFFNPWSTLRICRQLPELKLTFDFSHWCVVCERLMDTEMDVLEALAPQAFHIHARIGYDQGPQVPDPAIPRFRKELASHQGWWQMLWESMHARGFAEYTMTPEFGPDGYQAIDTVSNQPVGDLWQINQWMAQQQKQQFESFKAEKQKITSL